MADKVTHEVRLIETDDGFRIEVKGDKERLKKMFFHPGMMFGHKMGFGRRFRKARRSHGYGFVPGCRVGGKRNPKANQRVRHQRKHNPTE